MILKTWRTFIALPSSSFADCESASSDGETATCNKIYFWLWCWFRYWLYFLFWESWGHIFSFTDRKFNFSIQFKQVPWKNNFQISYQQFSSGSTQENSYSCLTYQLFHLMKMAANVRKHLCVVTFLIPHKMINLLSSNVIIISFQEIYLRVLTILILFELRHRNSELQDTINNVCGCNRELLSATADFKKDVYDYLCFSSSSPLPSLSTLSSNGNPMHNLFRMVLENTATH